VSAAHEVAEDEATRVERLLDEVRAIAGPVAWPRVEALVAALLQLHGVGLGRVLDCVRDAGADGLLERLCDDETVGALLALHDLHPLTPEERVQRALVALSPPLAEVGVSLELVAIEGAVAKFRARGERLAERSALLRRTATVAAERSRADVDEIEVEGLPPQSKGLIPVDRLLREVTR
jgi:hypothetical protein